MNSSLYSSLDIDTVQLGLIRVLKSVIEFSFLENTISLNIRFIGI